MKKEIDLHLTYENYKDYVIARTDATNDGYDVDGYCALYTQNNNRIIIVNFSHCSCFGTSTAICNSIQSYNDSLQFTEYNVMWAGEPEELIVMILASEDLTLEGRTIDPTDYDYKHIKELYSQIYDWWSDRSNGYSN